jgi:hypothetical protein
LFASGLGLLFASAIDDAQLIALADAVADFHNGLVADRVVHAVLGHHAAAAYAAYSIANDKSIDIGDVSVRV